MAGPARSGASRYAFDELVEFAGDLLAAAGLGGAQARAVAEVLAEADLLGHDTHGLQLLASYLAELEKGAMTKDGEPRVLAERASVATWDGERLPGPWLVRHAIDWARPRAQMHGAATVVIRRSHHIACLAAYLEPVARAGLMMVLASSDPTVASVAPFGGTQAVYTPNPIAIGIPTGGDPIMIDISASVTTNGMTARLKNAGVRGEHAWWLDALGQPTDDPGALFTQPPGTILPLGGLDAGHKGYGLALMIEALTAGLAGFGRADVVTGWGATVYLQLYDPDAFGGTGAFTWQTDWLAAACRASAPRVPEVPVRLPGERGLARKREQLRAGVALHPAILPALAPWAKKLAVETPVPMP
ncbi:MAG: Ldh family oxidoreductase [Burkholderiaceae bacterium]